MDTANQSRRRHHEQAIDAAHRAIPHPSYIGPPGATPAGDEWRQRRTDAARDHLLQVAGLDLEDLDEDTARWVEWFVRFGDADTVGGLCALIEHALADLPTAAAR